jgi:hypothetical protein
MGSQLLGMPKDNGREPFSVNILAASKVQKKNDSNSDDVQSDDQNGVRGNNVSCRTDRIEKVLP